MAKAVIGSTNEAKILGATKALRLLGVDSIVSISVKTGIEQPIGFKQTALLALIRARRALEYNGDYGVGIEGGILFETVYPLEAQIAIVIDKEFRASIGISTIFPLPRSFLPELKKKSLGEIMNSVTRVSNIGRLYGAIGYLTKGYITRIELSYQAVLSAIIPFINNKLYHSLPSDIELEETLKNRIDEP